VNSDTRSLETRLEAGHVVGLSASSDVGLLIGIVLLVVGADPDSGARGTNCRCGSVVTAVSATIAAQRVRNGREGALGFIPMPDARP
jgi:hypothetical protein